MARPFLSWPAGPSIAGALALGACFTGGFLAGQPCSSDADCGPTLRCEAGVCGGASAQTSDTSSSTAPVTTSSASTTVVDPTTGTTSSTSSTTSPVTGSSTSTTGDDTTGVPECGIGRCKDLDILFVADNSQSMLLKTLVLLDFIQTFSSELLPEVRKACSVHLGVVSTDAFAMNPPECQLVGALVTADNDGDPCMYVEGKPYATLPDLDQPLSLECLFNSGAEGNSDEQPIDALFTAVRATAVGAVDACNQDFYRPKAFLTVVMVTDEDDDNNDAQGHDGSEELLEQLWAGTMSNLKPNQYEDIYMVGLFGDLNNECMWDPLNGDDGLGFEQNSKLRAFIQSAPADHHALGSMCNVVPNGGQFVPLMQEIRAEIQAACDA